MAIRSETDDEWGPRRDRIALRDHVREVEIGAFEGERGRRQRVRFEVEADLEARPDARADDVDAVVSYDVLVDAVDAAMARDRFALLETLAERVADHALRQPGIARVRVRVEKLDLGPHALGVEIVRDRIAAAVEPAHPPPVRIEVLAADDRGPAAPGAVILVATPDFPIPGARTADAARRIALLALDQAGWRRAATRPDWIVAGTRAELDRAVRAGATAVWTPARMILAAADAPGTATPEAAARWLADAVPGASFDDGRDAP